MKILTLLALLLIATPLHAQEKLTSENIYKIVDQMPQPTVNLSEYLSANIHYPIFARKHNITGKVLVRFVVADDGALQ
ncbi:MAG: hypothetical protein EBZ77_08715, partial [Chitinophagia bacterium]|nr:hypothetical protein [Chitinophagia bacterium]